ncbi:MAG: hypothetical protein M1414_05960 [Candidatus Thermoplasmatota archaeon]|nr:hypothetical protein [Candidatus Thermoplasmatota archaeon]
MKIKRESKESNRTRIAEIEKYISNPESLVPPCLDKSMFCPLDGYRKKLSGGKDLEKFSKSKDEFLRGLAETSKAIADQDLSYSAMVKTPHGSATFFKKGDTDQYVLAGIQNSGSDTFRMLAFSKDVLSGKLILYSAGSYYMGTCRKSPPSMDFIEESLKKEHMDFSKDDDGVCRTGSGEYEASIMLLGMEILRIGPSKINSLSKVIKHMLFQSPDDLFTFSMSGMETYSHKLERDLLASYVSGSITDVQFLDSIYRKRLSNAQESGVIMVAGKEYNDIGELAESLGFPEDERDALVKVWDSREGLYLQEGSRRKLLEAIWDRKGSEFLQELFPGDDKESVRNLKGNPVEIIGKAREMKEIEDIEKSSGLEPWSEASSLAASMSLSMRRGRPMEWGNASTDSDCMAVEYAFGLHSGSHAPTAWKMPEEAKIKGQRILPLIEKMIKGTNEEAREAFSELKKYIR